MQPARPYQSPYLGSPYEYLGRPVVSRNNGLATASLVLGLVGIFLWILAVPSVLAVVFGHVALTSIGRSGGAQRGAGMAIAGLVLGYLELLGFIALIASTA